MPALENTLLSWLKLPNAPLTPASDLAWPMRSPTCGTTPATLSHSTFESFSFEIPRAEPPARIACVGFSPSAPPNDVTSGLLASLVSIDDDEQLVNNNSDSDAATSRNRLMTVPPR